MLSLPRKSTTIEINGLILLHNNTTTFTFCLGHVAPSQTHVMH
jgi:hypothetical protein